MDDMSIITYLNRNFMKTKKPLDVQIQEMRDYLCAYRIDASDEVRLETNNAAMQTETSITLPYSVTVDTEGTVRIYFTIKNGNNSYNTGFKIYKNGELATYKYCTTYARNETFYKDLSVEKGDVFTFELYTTSTNTTGFLIADSINICGTLTPLMQFDLIEVTEV